ncbi:hypothetical protein UlMin_007822 [Ulmus minor]
MQLSKRGPRKFSQSDDSTLVRQIKETHNPETYYVDVRPVLNIVESILHSAAPGIKGVRDGTHEDHFDERAAVSSFDDMVEGLSHLIHKISCEVLCKCSSGDLHASTLSLFKMLSNYPWEAKVVLTLAGFSVTYGEFWLVAQLCTSNPLAKSVALLKQVSDVIEQSKALEPQIEAINNLIKAIVDVTKCIVEFNELSSEYLSQDSPQVSVAQAHIPTAAYWTVRSIVACALHVSRLTDFRYEHAASTTEMWELSSLAQRLIKILDLLAQELAACRKHIDEMRHEEEYRNLIRLLESSHLDNMKILRALISTKDELPLLNNTSKTRVSIEVLRRKYVMLLISDLDISHDEITILKDMYDMRQDAPYELVWLPIVDRIKVWSEDHQHRFSELQAAMPWHSVFDPLIIEPPVVKYIREKWNFNKKMILVSLDPLGKVCSTNALHMLWIWGNTAYPFSHDREEAKWNESIWCLEFLAGMVHPEIQEWIAQGKYICLYGGDDIEWIRKFTTKAREVARALNIGLEMIYLGKSNIPKERLKRITTTIDSEGLGHCLRDPTLTWFFWARLESMRCSKTRYKKTIENDPILKEVMVILSYDGSDQGWAILWKGSTEMARANGQLALLTLGEYNLWEKEAQDMGLVPAFGLETEKRHSPTHCTRLILPGMGQNIPEHVVCTECGRGMEKFFMFRCCNE